MDNRGSDLTNTFYNLETLLKAAFILMSLFNLPYTLLVAFASSAIGVLRVCKNPQMSKQYLSKVLMNNHGQNILYITFGATGHVNYLYYSPIVLFFGYGIVEYIKIKHPQFKYSNHIDMIRNNKFYIFEMKGKLELIFLIYLIVTLPFDFMGRLIKIFLLGQLLIMKYKVNNEFKLTCSSVNAWILEKIKNIELIHSPYSKLTQWIYNFVNRDQQQQ